METSHRSKYSLRVTVRTRRLVPTIPRKWGFKDKKHKQRNQLAPKTKHSAEGATGSIEHHKKVNPSTGKVNDVKTYGENNYFNESEPEMAESTFCCSSLKLTPVNPVPLPYSLRSTTRLQLQRDATHQHSGLQAPAE